MTKVTSPSSLGVILKASRAGGADRFWERD